MKIAKIIVFLSVLFSISRISHASHFRYGHTLIWKAEAGSNAVDFKVHNVWRRGDYGCQDLTRMQAVPCTGLDGKAKANDIILEIVGATRFNTGDGTVIGASIGTTVNPPASPLYYYIDSSDSLNNWVAGWALDPAMFPNIDQTISHTYNTTGDFTAFIDSCCRIGSNTFPNRHVNNPDGRYRMETIVNVGSGNHSPVSDLPAIVTCPMAEANVPVVETTENEVEPNTTFAARNVFVNSGKLNINGAIVAGDRDIFEVSGLGSASINIEVISGTFDTILGLFDANGVLIRTDDDSGAGSLSRLTGVTPVNGVLRFGITGYSDFTFRGSHSRSGSYQIVLPALDTTGVSEITTSVNCAFRVPGVDEDGDRVRFRFSTALEAAGAGASFVQPIGASIDPATGVYSWNSSGIVSPVPYPGQNVLYSTQVMLEDIDTNGNVKSKTPLDFFVRVVDNIGTAPSILNSSPVCNSTIPAFVNRLVTFKVSATDPDLGQTITLNTSGLPIGVTMTPALPLSGIGDGSVMSAFSWRPGLNDVGTNVITFYAMDNIGRQSLCSTTIDVSEHRCGDLDGDGDVDTADNTLFKSALRSRRGDAAFIPEADYDADGVITLADYSIWYQCYKSFALGQ